MIPTQNVCARHEDKPSTPPHPAHAARKPRSSPTVWLAPQATSRTTTLGTGKICPSFVFSMKMATRRGTSSQSYSIRCARAMNFPSELCPAATRASGQQRPRRSTMHYGDRPSTCPNLGGQASAGPLWQPRQCSPI